MRPWVYRMIVLMSLGVSFDEWVFTCLVYEFFFLLSFFGYLSVCVYI